MTTQQKTEAIKEIISNRQDNRAALDAATDDEILLELANKALTEAFQADLHAVFALKQN